MTSPSFVPVPPGGRDEDKQAADAQDASAADAARPFEEAPDVETEQATGMAPLDPSLRLSTPGRPASYPAR